jgi:hypothetical protein
MTLPRHYPTLDHLVVASLEMKAKNYKAAAEAIKAATESPDFEEAIATLDEINDKAFLSENESDGVQDDSEQLAALLELSEYNYDEDSGFSVDDSDLTDEEMANSIRFKKLSARVTG